MESITTENAISGRSQTLATRKKISLANSKNRSEILLKVNEYISELPKKTGKDAFPSITSASLYAGISEKTLLRWEASEDPNSELCLTMEHLRDLQKDFLIKNGLFRETDNKITVLLLKANHGLREEPTTLTQNNTFNVSPEILAEAIELSRKSKA